MPVGPRRGGQTLTPPALAHVPHAMPGEDPDGGGIQRLSRSGLGAPPTPRSHLPDVLLPSSPRGWVPEIRPPPPPQTSLAPALSAASALLFPRKSLGFINPGHADTDGRVNQTYIRHSGPLVLPLAGSLQGTRPR